MIYFQTLLDKGTLNKFETLELVNFSEFLIILGSSCFGLK